MRTTIAATVGLDAGRMRTGLATLAACAGWLIGGTSLAADEPYASAKIAIQSPAVGEPVIKRDEYGVPHVFAKSAYDLFFGFGYALGEDQLYQLEILKRTARGRVAEALGRRYLPVDKLARLRIDCSSLLRQFAALPHADQDILRGMAAGISARVAAVLQAREQLLPKAFTDSGFLPEAWSVLDVMAVYEHSMAVRFSDLNAELDNLALLTRLRRSQEPIAAWKLFEQLRWVTDDAAPTTISTADEHTGPVPTNPAAQQGQPGALPNRLAELRDAILYDTSAAAAAIRPSSPVAHASNAWLASPAFTHSGETVLVNGPQMGDYASAYLWAIGLHGAGFNVVGSGPVGSPWLVFGTNGDIGWGATAGLGDTVDIYQEKLDPRRANRYLFKGRSLPMQVRREVILIKGEAPITLTLYATLHGSVELFDPANGIAYSRKRSWAGSEIRSLMAWIHAMKARDYAHWRADVAEVSITVNNYYADRSGHIAYQFLGRFPIRPADQDFRLPANGDGSMEWKGFYSTTSNPYVLDPKSGFIANWNNKPQPGYHNSDFMYWSRVDRDNEILDAVENSEQRDSRALWDINEHIAFTDVTARYWIALIRARERDFQSSAKASQAARLLTAWDGSIADRTSEHARPEYLLYQKFLSRLLTVLYAPIVPRGGPGRPVAEKDFLQFDAVFPSLGIKIAATALAAATDSPVLGGRRSQDLLSQALSDGLDEMSAQFGPDPAAWVMPAMPHAFSQSNYAGVAENTDSKPPSLPVHMNRGTENDRIVFENGLVSYCDVTPPGQSSFVAANGRKDPHYDDQLAIYQAFGCKPQWLTSADVAAHTRSVERLHISTH